MLNRNEEASYTDNSVACFFLRGWDIFLKKTVRTMTIATKSKIQNTPIRAFFHSAKLTIKNTHKSVERTQEHL